MEGFARCATHQFMHGYDDHSRICRRHFCIYQHSLKLGKGYFTFRMSLKFMEMYKFSGLLALVPANCQQMEILHIFSLCWLILVGKWKRDKLLCQLYNSAP